MIIPPYIQKGDTIGLISPAGKIAHQVVTIAGNYLEHAGFPYVQGACLSGAWNQFSGTDEQRVSDINEMIHNPEVKMIWCSRGGYGTMRLLNRIDWAHLKKNPKWLVGFSDITAFHSALQNVHGMVSIHGPMLKNLVKGNFEFSGVKTLWDMVQGEMPDYVADYQKLNRTGDASGVLIGGNLTLLSALKGSVYDFHPKGKILFIEEVGEHFYHLDRMMQGLKISGKLSALSGLVVGQMTDMSDNATPFGATANEIVMDAVKDYDFPVMFGFPAGHDVRNEPLLMGAKVQLSVSDNQSRLKFLNSF
ncbi:S66 peptidase family protein [Alkalitalea saponilacus]|uniref:Muramoyltetrapeptide carboxypeptidase n=1 Tax=Alkalitalea saponilacus TaxID=889453 RepID=A0A1T5FAF0_9BACT|nr:LD-carboxypeptidase [Alkalitalea saponilacus]ASB50097.1 LD-carboxypeptidase [Alkalitalea saponilacus]SKB93139.1 muramoyltetrapeptide carboxypeptidase [Alkalitalea saponilacus]